MGWSKLRNLTKWGVRVLFNVGAGVAWSDKAARGLTIPGAIYQTQARAPQFSPQFVVNRL